MLLVGFTGYQALKARTALSQVADDFDVLSGQLTSGDQAGAARTLGHARREARVALDNTHGPGWWLASTLPQIGPNVQAVRVVAEVADGLASDVLPDVVRATSTLRPENLRPQDGRVDLAPVRRVTPAVTRAARRLSVQATKVDSVDAAVLAPQIAGPVASLQSRIDRADELATRASRAVQLLPSMLGADGPRRYLFMFQNNAEVRATGGIPGAFAIITADRGRVSLGAQANAGKVGISARPVVPLSHQERTTFGSAMARFPQDVNFTPDFPRSAEIIKAMWEKRHPGRLDGVLSADPVALSYLLQGTGAVPTAGGRTLTADTAVSLLLSDTYAQIPDPAKQNDFFDAAARSVFRAVTHAQGDPRAVLGGLTRAASERRLLVWSDHRQEQRLLSPTPLAGAVPTASTRTPDVGVFLNAAAAYKLDYYLDGRASLESRSCRGGLQRLRLTLHVRSLLPPGKVHSLSSYVAPVRPGYGRGFIATTAFYYLPVGGRLTGVSVDGVDQPSRTQRVEGRTVLVRSFGLKPSQQHTVVVDMVAGAGQVGDPQLRVTPGSHQAGIGRVGPSACR